MNLLALGGLRFMLHRLQQKIFLDLLLTIHIIHIHSSLFK